MAQWDVYPNPVAGSRDRVPYLVVLQNDLLAELPTRLVAPLSRRVVMAKGASSRLSPDFDIHGEHVVLKPHEVGTIEGRLLRRPVTNLRSDSHRIVDAIDAVISGI